MNTLIESRADFQHLANVRLAEAKALLDVGLWDGAYYLAGYAVELALKACIIKRLMATDAFPDKEFSRNCYTHDLKKLIDLAGLKPAHKARIDGEAPFEKNWSAVEVWSEEKRYWRIDQGEAEGLYAAITDTTYGILTWIKAHW